MTIINQLFVVMWLIKLFACCLCMAALPAFAEPVERVEVQITDNGATSRVLLDRMGKSMQVVAEQLLSIKTALVLMPHAAIMNVCWRK